MLWLSGKKDQKETSKQTGLQTLSKAERLETRKTTRPGAIPGECGGKARQPAAGVAIDLPLRDVSNHDVQFPNCTEGKTVRQKNDAVT